MSPKLNFLSYKTAVCGEISAAVIVHETGNMAIKSAAWRRMWEAFMCNTGSISLGIFTPNKKNVLLPFSSSAQGEN